MLPEGLQRCLEERTDTKGCPGPRATPGVPVPRCGPRMPGAPLRDAGNKRRASTYPPRERRSPNAASYSSN